MRSRHIRVEIDLDRVRASAEAIRRRTGVALIAVVKADAYGLGAGRVIAAIESVADSLAFFSLHEARAVGRGGLVLGPPAGAPQAYRDLGLRPTVTDAHQARRLAGLPVAVCVDTGMQWLGCPPETLDELLAITQADEVYTHGNDVGAARRLRKLVRGRAVRLHAAATALLDQPEAWLDAVRPGLALYRGAVRVTGRLAAVRPTRGPVGYSGFESACVGILLAGYSHGLRPAPVIVNGRRQRILEVGMNTALVSVDPTDRAGDPVVLLGDALPESDLADALGVRPHEVLCRYTALGRRIYRGMSAGK